MGFVSGIGDALGSVTGGLSGGIANNNKFKANGIQTPITSDQATNTYQDAETALAKQQAFVNALQAQNGIANQSSVFNQLQGVANGTGPNPAQAMLANSTGANTVNQAALMASQRGAGVNPALIARQAAMQGGANQQTAAGQAAALQANQSLNALNQLGGIAGQQVGQQQNALTGYNQFAQGQEGQVLGAVGQQNNALNGQSGINSGVAAQNSKQQFDMTGGLLGGAGKALAMAEGGQVPSPHKSFVGRVLSGNVPAPQMLAHGGKVPALLSPGERYLPPKAAEKVAEKKADPTKAGVKVPGKAKVEGDSLKNDTVKAKLSPGGVVIPRSVMNSKNPSEAAAKFVTAVLAKSKMKK